jgi:hypothetical protein
MQKHESAAARVEHGVQALASLLNHWLASSSNDRLSAIFRYAYGESTGLDGGAISRIRNGRQPRGAGLKHLDAMSEANRCIWIWHQLGPEAAIKEFGPHSSWDVQAEWLDDAIWLPSPIDPTQPLDLGELAMLLMGRIELPYLGQHLLAPAKLSRMSERLPELLDDLAAEQGWRMREALTAFIAAYPSRDPSRLRRFRELVTGAKDFTGPELESELAALAQMIATIRQLDSYTPAELQAELLSVRRSRS